jgi:hypothetical protein
MSHAYASAIEDGSRVLTIIFIFEAAIKLTGLGVWGYMADPFNKFDFVIAMLGLVELIIAVRARLLQCGARCATPDPCAFQPQLHSSHAAR